LKNGRREGSASKPVIILKRKKGWRRGAWDVVDQNKRETHVSVA